MKQNAFTQLLDRYLNRTAGEEEIALVDTYLDELEKGPVKQRTPEEIEARQARLFKKIKAGLKPRSGLLISMSNKRKVGIAAAIMLVAAVSVWVFVSTQSKISGIVPLQVAVRNITAPDVNRAIITLADGKKVYLDSAGSGELALQGNTKLVKLSDGQIAYQSSGGEIIKELKYNTLSNPRGSKVIDMRLSDGSHVWLNSGSSITYPVAFVGSDRKVTIEGEAYFEVAPDKAKPFIVSRGEMSIQVLGTHFNVNAYSDEQDIKVTLLEGSVKVASNNSSRLIEPGQQAVIDNDIKLNTDVDLEQVMAWKNGRFDFGESTDLKDIMRQLSRWYDVDIEYRGIVNQKFWGSISRQENVSKVLEKFELTGRVHFVIEGRKIIVSP